MPPTVESVYPADIATGVVIGATIWIIFDSEIDPTTVARSFLIEANDSDRWTGPDMQLWDRASTPAPDYYLESPGYKGIVQGTFTYEKLDAGNNSSSSPTYDPSASVFKTKLIFTPDNPLAVSYEYRVYIAGDENSSDDIKVGIASRTVGDVELGANTGDGVVTVSGGYTGTAEQTLNIEIVVSGGPGVGRYEWYYSSNPLDVRTGTVSQQEALLSNGLYIEFSNDTFTAGDTYSVSLDPPTYMEDTYSWTFTTGSGNISALPSTTSTSVLGDVGVPVADADLAVSSTTPEHLSLRNPKTLKRFTVTFNKDIALPGLDQVIIDILPVLGSYTGNEGSFNVPKILSVSGNILTIEI